MGKRKERRLAAMQATGRRVKLDLFAEPSGEAVGGSLHDEVGRDLDQDNNAGVPTSPYSSGQRQENPLLLLGQYSDDELHEEASTQPKHVDEMSPSTDSDDQAEEPVDVVGAVSSVAEKDTHDGVAKQDSDQLNVMKSQENDTVLSNISSAAIQQDETHSTTELHGLEPSGTDTSDVTGGWKMVMDEQSHQYYYWNTLTGETSWVVPAALSAEAEITAGQSASSAIVERTDFITDMQVSTHMNPALVTYADPSAANHIGGSDLISGSIEGYAPEMEKGTEGGALSAYDASQSLLSYGSTLAVMSYGNASALPAFGSSHQLDSLLSGHGDKLMMESSASYETVDGHPSRLVKYCEDLLQKLSALEGSGDKNVEDELMKKEVEIRLSDCKVLSSYGASLLPFWWHTEMQLRQLESDIQQKECSKLYRELEEVKYSGSENGHSLPQSAAGVSETIEDGKSKPHDVENSSTPTGDPLKEAQIEATNMPDGDGANAGNLSSGSTCQLISNYQEPELLDANQKPYAVHSVPHFEAHAKDDMDVEMEVDEETPAVEAADGNVSFADGSAVAGQLDQLDPLPQCHLVPPPPPDEEWIPPPPPDGEMVPPPPPPPPEEAPIPPEPPYAGTIPPHPYQEQYSVGYSVPTYEYYAPATREVTNNGYYAHADGEHIAEPQALPYYNSIVAGAFPALDAEVAPAESMTYYNSTSGNVPAAAVMSSMESSGYYVEAGSTSYLDNVVLAAHNATVGPVAVSQTSSLSTVKVDLDSTSVSSCPQTAVLQAAPFSADIQPSETAVTKESTQDMLPPATSKNQAKAVRSKKRTIAVAPTLRSNKRVSSLVDKWKAAKEELHGDDEEEPENAYEALEKKHQKEIEEWRARQIASGEARDNANFIPLGGDWRERVKRKKTQVKPEAKVEEIRTPAEPIVNDRRQPDLIELSKELPSGWQAYWDEATKEVYYGNIVTSETTWTRPKR